jgi:hypothetical protein
VIGVAHPVALAVGDEGFCIVAKPVGRRGTRFEVEGPARVRVVALNENRVDAEVIAAPSSVRVGRRIELARGAFYAEKSPAENRAFGAVIDRLWGRR